MANSVAHRFGQIIGDVLMKNNIPMVTELICSLKKNRWRWQV